MSSIGDKPAFPTKFGEAEGMTYRQWLIGQVLPTLQTVDPGSISFMLMQVDDTIAKLDAEAAQKKPGIR